MIKKNVTNSDLWRKVNFGTYFQRNKNPPGLDSRASSREGRCSRRWELTFQPQAQSRERMNCEYCEAICTQILPQGCTFPSKAKPPKLPQTVPTGSNSYNALTYGGQFSLKPHIAYSSWTEINSKFKLPGISREGQGSLMPALLWVSNAYLTADRLMRL